MNLCISPGYERVVLSIIVNLSLCEELSGLSGLYRWMWKSIAVLMTDCSPGLWQALSWGRGRFWMSPLAEQETAHTWQRQYHARSLAAMTGCWWNWRSAFLTMTKSADLEPKTLKYSASTVKVRNRSYMGLSLLFQGHWVVDLPAGGFPSVLPPHWCHKCSQHSREEWHYYCTCIRKVS